MIAEYVDIVAMASIFTAAAGVWVVAAGPSPLLETVPELYVYILGYHSKPRYACPWSDGCPHGAIANDSRPEGTLHPCFTRKSEMPGENTPLGDWTAPYSSIPKMISAKDGAVCGETAFIALYAKKAESVEKARHSAKTVEEEKKQSIYDDHVEIFRIPTKFDDLKVLDGHQNGVEDI